MRKYGIAGIIFLAIIAVCLYFSFRIKKHEKNVLAVVLMVKNEVDVIVPTLKPFVDAGVTSFFVFDTGSTDGTQGAVRRYFESNNTCTLVLAEEPFIDFATSRNRALTLAEQAFPEISFLVMPDAEWYLQNVQELCSFCESYKDSPDSCYLIRIMNEATDFYVPRLIRARSGAKFVGAVHEIVESAASDLVPETVFFELRVAQKGYEKSCKRWLKDCEVLKNELEKNPDNPRLLFYLAQTYECLEDWQHAHEFYKKRTLLDGWDEENYMAYYKCAYTLDRLSCENKCDAWDEVLKTYLTAHALRPHRAEPLIRIAEHYLEGDNLPLCYLFASRALQLSYPEDDILFIEKEMYEYIRYDIIGQCAYAVDEYEVGKKAVLKALSVHPDYEHLQHNLQLYNEYV